MPTCRLLRALACFFVLCLLPVPKAQALDGAFRIGDLRHDVWGPKDGAPQTPISMTQTADGWMWIGAYHGLYRFDGVRFERFTPLPGEALLYRTVSSLTATADGDLLIGYLTGGFSILRKGHLLHMTSVQRQPFSNTYTVQADLDGSYWVGAVDGLLHLQAGAWTKIGADWDYPGGATDNIVLDRYGRLFVSNGKRIYMLDRARRKFVDTGLHSAKTNADFLFDTRKDLWVGTDGKLARMEIDPGALRPSITPNDPVAIALDLLFDRDGNLWTRADGNRICMIPRTRLPATAAFDVKPLLSGADCMDSPGKSSNVMAMLEDRDGNIWIARANGLERFRQHRLRTIAYPSGTYRATVASSPEGVVSVTAGDPAQRYEVDGMTLRPAAVHADAQQQWGGNPSALLLATPRGLVLRENGRERTIPYPPGLPAATDRVRHLVQENDGVFWIGWSQSGLWRYAAGTWSKPKDEGAPVARAAMASDGRGVVWRGYANNTIVRTGPDGVRRYDAADGVDVRVATFIDVRHEVLAAGDGGLQVLDGARFRHVRAADPDALSGISGLAIAADGDRWFNTHRGVLHVRARDWQEAMRSPDTLLRYELLDQLDGYPDGAQTGNASTAAATPDGRLWFVASGGVALYDPRHDAAAIAPPPPAIRAVIAGGRRYDPLQPIRLQPGTDHVAIEFSALNFTKPERTLYRYRLDGAERDWQGPLATPTISYANLAPGHYVFTLQAAIQGGAWSTRTARVGFEIEPRFTQTRWFLGLCALALSGAAALLYRWRMREVTTRLHLLLGERQRIARTLHDTFLQSLQSLVWRFDQVKDTLPLAHQDRRLLDATLAQANQVMAEGRHQILDLRPGVAERADLEARLAMACESFRARHAAAIEIAVHDPLGLALLPAVADEAYHIAHEALSNALYHGRTTRLDVQLDYTPAEFVLRVADDGGGFDPALLAAGGRDGHWGLTGMRERARAIGGALAIDTGRHGTTVVLRVPKAAAYARRRRA